MMPKKDAPNTMNSDFDNSRIEKEFYDVVVIGGGLAGVCAALSSARQGAKTVLIQDRPMLGGNASGEIGVGIHGASEMGRYRYSRETGIMDELYSRNVELPNPMESGSLFSLVLWETVREQNNLTVHLNSIAAYPKLNDNKIVSVAVEQTTTERRFEISGNIFIDCSGDGRVGCEAGADFMFGREGRDEFNESLAPEQADDKVMGNTVYIKARDMGHPVPYSPPAWIHSITSDDQLPKKGQHAPHNIHQLLSPNGGWWWIEFGGTLGTIENAEKIRDELLRYAIGVWDHMKNHGDHGAENYVLESIGFLPGKRESRRFIGDHILCQNDLESLVRFDDVIAYSQWHVDIHNPLGITSNGPYWTGALLKSRCDIPLRSLYSRNIENLFFAGRNISATHVAMASTRVMATCGVMGQAVGSAASLCIRYECSPRDIYKSHISELQQMLLKDDCYLPFIKNQDTEDMARQAEVCSSSQATLEFPEPKDYPTLEDNTAQAFIVSNDRLNSVSLYLDNKTDQIIDVKLHLRSGQWVDDFTSEQDIAVSTASILPGKSLAEFDFNGQSVEPGKQYWIMLEGNKSLGWGFSCQEPPCATGAWMIDQIYGDPPAYRMFKRERGINCLILDPPSQCFGPQHVINGVSRPERSSNLWISDKGLPQWIDLNWEQPESIKEVHITFDNNLDRKRSYWCQLGKAPELVKTYKISAELNGELKPICTIENNSLRKRVHKFDEITTNRIRIEVLETWGKKSDEEFNYSEYRTSMKGIAAAARDYVDYECDEARIYEIRIY